MSAPQTKSELPNAGASTRLAASSSPSRTAPETKVVNASAAPRADTRTMVRRRLSPPALQLRERERPVPPRRDAEVLAVCRPEHGVEPLAAGARRERDLPPGQHAVHREPVAVEVVARGVEDDEVDAG